MTSFTKCYVKKRNGTLQEIDGEKIRTRLIYLTLGKPDKNEPIQLQYLEGIDIDLITKKVINNIVNNTQTNEIDESAARICHENSHENINNDKMASRIIISNLHKNTRGKTFLGITEYLYYPGNNNTHSILSTAYYKFVEKNHDKIESLIDYSRDYRISYFGFKTLERSYLLRKENLIVERPQHMWMRIAISINMNVNDYCCEKAWNCIVETYEAMSLGYYTHASPTIFNAGTNHPQLSSCFLLGSKDSREGIMKTAKDISKISKWAGGVGFHSDWRSCGSTIKGTNGTSSGPIPFLQMYDKLLSAFNQGGKRKGSGAAYMKIDHPDIVEFIECRLPHKTLDETTPDLFLAVVIPDLYMKRVHKNEYWSLFDPNDCPELMNKYGEEYEKIYIKYEQDGKARKRIKARDLLERLAYCRLESGMPYIMYIDAVNRRSNQKNIGVIRSSNLCQEISLYSDTQEYACCTLASLCLPQFVEEYDDKTKQTKQCEFPNNPKFNFMKLTKIARIAFRNLNKIIDVNWYPCIETELSNKRHRPLGVGVQGLADVYHKMKYAYDSTEAEILNKQIFETIYYACIVESCNLAKELYDKYKKTIKENGFANVVVNYRTRRKFNSVKDEEDGNVYEIIEPVYKHVTEKELATTSGAYSSYHNSPISEGKFQFDLWNDEYDAWQKTVDELSKYNSNFTISGKTELSGMWDWDSLRQKIKKFGVRNSVAIALMPTASTSQIMGNTESFEPYTHNIYRRDTLAGSFICINKYMMKELSDLGMWNSDVYNCIMSNDGRLKYVEGIPDDIKNRYKTNYELSQKVSIKHEADRSPFVDQAQSANRYLNKTTKSISSVTTMDLYAWKMRLKTGQYYLRTEDFNDPQKFTIKVEKTQHHKKKENITTVDEKDICLSCQA